MLLVRSEYVESLVKELKLLVEHICKIYITIPMHWNKVKQSVSCIEYLCPVIGTVSLLKLSVW